MFVSPLIFVVSSKPEMDLLLVNKNLTDLSCTVKFKNYYFKEKTYTRNNTSTTSKMKVIFSKYQNMKNKSEFNFVLSSIIAKN